MNKELKEKWVAALRSGEYKQGKGVLKGSIDGGEIKYCCLGVLCEISGVKNDIDNRLYRFYDRNDHEVYSYTFPPNEFLHEIELLYKQGLELSSMNDSDKYTFEEIAKHIEDNF